MRATLTRSVHQIPHGLDGIQDFRLGKRSISNDSSGDCHRQQNKRVESHVNECSRLDLRLDGRLTPDRGGTVRL